VNKAKVREAITDKRAVCEGCGNVTTIPLYLSRASGNIVVETCNRCGDNSNAVRSESAWRVVMFVLYMEEEVMSGTCSQNKVRRAAAAANAAELKSAFYQ
jgi:hypothetical protein